MGFYYNSGQPQPDDEKPSGIRDVIAITFAVFAALALPLGFIFGMVFYIIALFWTFSMHWALGVTWLSLLVIALVGRGIWEAKHPPELK